MTIRPKRSTLAVLGVLVLIAAGGLLVGLGSRADAPTGGRSDAGITPEVRAARPAAMGEKGAPATTSVKPRRLRIPALEIDAPVKPVAAEGLRLDPPSDPQIVGWWSAGPLPGAELGTAILTAHTVSTGGGVFDDLDLMRRGQRVQILSGGSRLNLQVTSVTTYDKASLAEHAAEVFNQTAAGRVALVTCEDWTGSTYLSNVVVIAEPAS